MGQGIYTAILWGATVNANDYPEDIIERWNDFHLLKTSYESDDYMGFMVADSDGNINICFNAYEFELDKRFPQRGFCFHRKAFNLADLEFYVNQANLTLLQTVKSKWKDLQLELKLLGFELPDGQFILVCDWH